MAAILTPLRPSGEIDVDRWARHIRWVIRNGCDGVALFGTTGEVSSFSVRERNAALSALIRKGVPADRLIVGTGCTALDDAGEASRHALAEGVAGMLVIPPFFFKPVTDAGVFGFYASLIARAADPRLRICLYDFPEMSGVGLSLDLVARLRTEFPDRIVAIKDSSGDLEKMTSLVTAVPDIAVFTGDDHLLRPLLRAGGAGSITAGGNVWPGVLARLRDNSLLPDGATANEQGLVEAAWRDCLLKLPVTEALKELFAQATGDAAWLGMRPPLVRLDERQRGALAEGVRDAGLALDRGLVAAAT